MPPLVIPVQTGISTKADAGADSRLRTSKKAVRNDEGFAFIFVRVGIDLTSFPYRRESTPLSVIPMQTRICASFHHSRADGNLRHLPSFPCRREPPSRLALVPTLDYGSAKTAVRNDGGFAFIFLQVGIDLTSFPCRRESTPPPVIPVQTRIYTSFHHSRADGNLRNLPSFPCRRESLSRSALLLNRYFESTHLACLLSSASTPLN
jgi:hypothetical protein